MYVFNVCMYVCMHACMHVCMYACMHVCMCMYMYMHEHRRIDSIDALIWTCELIRSSTACLALVAWIPAARLR